ncbi:MAG: biotin/lipoyl-binding protein [Cyanobacteriota bacterium]
MTPEPSFEKDSRPRLPAGPLPLALVAALAGSALTLTALLATRQLALPNRAPATVSRTPAKPVAPRPTEAVAALGRLEPAGDIRVLAAPIAGIGGSPRLTNLLVNEGDSVRQGQLLARFDTGPTLAAEQQLVLTRLANLQRRLQVEQRELNRYRQLTQVGALSAD